MSGIIPTNRLTQVGFIVKDIEKSRYAFARFFGVEPPAICDGGQYEVTHTVYQGQPAPLANCLMAFFDVGENLQIDLIQPNGEKSTWQEFLDEHGEGIHHIAFHVKNMDEHLHACEENGMPCVQRGLYGNAGGQYAYLDAHADLKCFVELLENFE